MRLNLRSRARLQAFLSEARLAISVRCATGSRHVVSFHVKRTHASAGVRDVNDSLSQRQIVSNQRVHIHTVCENFTGVKEC